MKKHINKINKLKNKYLNKDKCKKKNCKKKCKKNIYNELNEELPKELVNIVSSYIMDINKTELHKELLKNIENRKVICCECQNDNNPYSKCNICNKKMCYICDEDIKHLFGVKNSCYRCLMNDEYCSMDISSSYYEEEFGRDIYYF